MKITYIVWKMDHCPYANNRKLSQFLMTAKKYSAQSTVMSCYAGTYNSLAGGSRLYLENLTVAKLVET
jgi:hypothetical protein